MQFFEKSKKEQEKILSRCIKESNNMQKNMSKTKTIEDINKKFDKEVVDYFWNKKTVVGTQRLSMSHIEKIKNFYNKEITELLESLRVDMKKEVEYASKDETLTAFNILETAFNILDNQGYNQRERKLRKDINKILNK